MVRRTTAVEAEGGPLAVFARELRELRAARGSLALGIDEISSAEGIPRSTLYAALKGTRLPSREVVAALVRSWGGDEAAWIARRSVLEDAVAKSVSRRPSQSLRDGSVWTTVQTSRTVLVVVRNSISLARALDVVSLLGKDVRVQVLFTVEEGSAFASDLPTMLREQGVVEVPWHEATRRRFDLVLATEIHSRLASLMGPAVLVVRRLTEFRPPNGVGAAADRGTAGSGLGWSASPQFEHLSGVIGVADDTEVDRVRAMAPALSADPVVVGDPMLDRLVTSWPCREHYRAVLGVEEEHCLVVVTSTWGPSSLFGQYPRVPEALLEQLPENGFRVALVLHPNVWVHHGSWQITGWLRTALDHGLLLIPPLGGEQAALVAADVVIGDHGALTAYAAALDHPVLAIDDEEPVQAATRDGASADAVKRHLFDPGGDLSAQVMHARRHCAPRNSVGELAVKAAEHTQVLREVLYTALELAQPVAPPELAPVDNPVPVCRSAARPPKRLPCM
ncbi:helix-turn-helix transcriptional regulator [Amycolatopsis minnesotensis]|uniref:HTH cro/C1-type domain-containing protein n=1 Tax=Amycolatopsis minnesotensis TaxID=337894 RepID=A0ABN2SYS6_9PSEU